MKRPADMKRHIEHKHCPQRVKCPLCDKVYKTESCRQMHVRKHHHLCLTGREIRDMEANPYLADIEAAELAGAFENN